MEKNLKVPSEYRIPPEEFLLDTEDAIITLEFVERSLTDVESIIPQEFGSDMSNIDTSALSKEDMDTVNELTDFSVWGK